MLKKYRNFLLKRKPYGAAVYTLSIEEFYENNYRYRKISKSGNITFERAIIKNVDTGVDQIIEDVNVSYLEFMEGKIGKGIDRGETLRTRYCYQMEPYPIFIDVYMSLSIITMEVENVEIKEELKFDKAILDTLLLEVTEMDQFLINNIGKT